MACVSFLQPSLPLGSDPHRNGIPDLVVVSQSAMGTGFDLDKQSSAVLFQVWAMAHSAEGEAACLTHV